MSEKRVKFSNLPINARHKLTHYKRLYKKNELPTYIIEELKKENMLYLLESRPSSSPQIFKDQLLELARTGQPRPNSKTKLGKFLSTIYSINHESYDAIVVTELKQLRPDWFNKSKRKINLDQLFELAKNDQDRPSQKTKLGRFLQHLCNGDIHDQIISAELKQLRPDWFYESRKKINVEQLMQLAKTGQPRPSQKTKLGRFLGDICKINGNRHDPIVSAELKQLRPDWFRK